MTQGTIKLYAKLYLYSRIRDTEETIELIEKSDSNDNRDKQLEFFKDTYRGLKLELEELEKM